MTDSIAKVVFDYNVEMQNAGQVNGRMPILPPGVVGKFLTSHAHGRPYNNGIIFEDGSELTVGFGGDYFWGKAGEWKAADKKTFEVELGDS